MMRVINITQGLTLIHSNFTKLLGVWCAKQYLNLNVKVCTWKLRNRINGILGACQRTICFVIWVTQTRMN